MYERYCRIRDERGMKDSVIAKQTGITKSTFSDWKNGRSVPKREKLAKIADCLGVSLDYLVTGEEPEYYLDPDTTKEAQAVFDDPNLRMLFDAAKDSRPENIRLAAEMLQRFKEMSGE